MSRKIAPTLAEQVEAYNEVPTVSGRNPTGKAMRAELRALLAVARAAQYEGWGADHHEQRSKGTCRLCRALARLDKVSGRKP